MRRPIRWVSGLATGTALAFVVGFLCFWWFFEAAWDCSHRALDHQPACGDWYLPVVMAAGVLLTVAAFGGGVALTMRALSRQTSH